MFSQKMVRDLPKTPNNSGAVARNRAIDEPWIEPLTGWRRAAVWFGSAVLSWLLLAGVITTVYELIAVLG